MKCIQHNEGKSFIPERFIRILKNEIYKCTTSISKNIYIDNLDNKVNKYSNTYYNTIIMTPADVKSNKYIDSNKENIEKEPKFKIGDFVRI